MKKNPYKIKDNNVNYENIHIWIEQEGGESTYE